MALGDSAKADQIAFHIYTKLFHVLYAARASEQAPGPAQGKTDKWVRISFLTTISIRFILNLFGFYCSSTSKQLDSFRALSASPPPPQTAPAVQILLVVPPPGGGTALVHKASGARVEPEPH
jgi:autophagy-related protein 13